MFEVQAEGMQTRVVSISDIKKQQVGQMVNWESEIWRVTLRSVKVLTDYIERVIKP